MATKSRVKEGAVSIKFSFGRAKAGMEFKDRDAYEDYIAPLVEEAHSFSLDAVPSSPYIRRVGAAKRTDTWNKPQQIIEFINGLYKSPSSKLHHGFLKEHSNSFFRIISASLSIHKDNSYFLPFLTNTSTDTPTGKDIDKHLLSVYVNGHQNDVPGNLMPETSKYPPTNEGMMVIPPTLREWRATNQLDTNFNLRNPIGFNNQMHSIQAVTPMNNVGGCIRQDGGTIGITFKAEWDDKEELSVMIDGDLSMSSTMEDVMIDGEVVGDFRMGRNLDRYKFQLQKKGTGRLTLKWKKFSTMTVQLFTNIHNIDDNYVFTVKN